MTAPVAPVPGVDLIAAERQRQLAVEGWTAVHDAHHEPNELAMAAASYALPDYEREFVSSGHQVPRTWPWEEAAWKPSPDDRVRELVKAGALIAAEIDRLQVPQEGAPR